MAPRNEVRDGMIAILNGEYGQRIRDAGHTAAGIALSVPAEELPRILLAAAYATEHGSDDDRALLDIAKEVLNIPTHLTITHAHVHDAADADRRRKQADRIAKRAQVVAMGATPDQLAQFDAANTE